MLTKRTCRLPLICLICGDVARGINFDVMTCTSCKTFFRRYALKSYITRECQKGNNCKITLQTRRNCSACRLKKCFTLGMNPRLVGHRFESQLKTNQIHYLKFIKSKNNQPSQPFIFSLLENDCSTLTTNEWNLLSNIIFIYDSVNAISQTKYLLEQQSSLPPKLRSKLSATYDIIKIFFSTFQPFLERIPYFHQLSFETYQTILRHNSVIFGTLNSFFIMRETKALEYPAFLIGCNTIYGTETMQSSNIFIQRLENNSIFIKIMLLILACSTNCSIVIPDYSEDLTMISNSISIISLENIFITIFWKYLIYQYGFIVAVRCFNIFIKYILDVLQSMSETPNEQQLAIED